MKGKLYIDGKDAYLNFGVFITKGGYEGLVGFPALKKIEYNDWAEEDGIEPDLSEPALDTHEFPIKFGVHGFMLSGGVGDFFALISDLAYHVFEFPELGKAFYLRLVSQQNLAAIEDLQLFTLQFANDFPLDGFNYAGELPQGFPGAPYTYVEPKPYMAAATGYELDGRDLSEYGVTVLKGTAVEILKSPAVKKNLLQNISSKSGALYEGQLVNFQTKEVKINCLMQAGDMNHFWRNHNALLFDLSRPQERTLYVDNTGYEYPCYYKSCSVNKFRLFEDVWYEFTLTLVFISFRLEEEEYVLASEDGICIITEDDEYLIDLREDGTQKN